MRRLCSDRRKWALSKGGSRSKAKGGGGGSVDATASPSEIASGSASLTAEDQRITAEAETALRGGAIVVYSSGDLSSNRKAKVIETVKIGDRVYRKRLDKSPIEAATQARIKAYTRAEEINKKANKLTKENKALKGKENSALRAANNEQIKRLKAQSQRYTSLGHKLVGREMELKRGGIKFAFSGAKSKRVVLGQRLNREYNANRVLGIKTGSTVKEANQAYKRLARRYHPDNNPNASPREQQRNARKFQLATEAYQAYKDAGPKYYGIKQ